MKFILLTICDWKSHRHTDLMFASTVEVYKQLEENPPKHWQDIQGKDLGWDSNSGSSSCAAAALTEPPIEIAVRVLQQNSWELDGVLNVQAWLCAIKSEVELSLTDWVSQTSLVVFLKHMEAADKLPFQCGEESSDSFHLFLLLGLTDLCKLKVWSVL